MWDTPKQETAVGHFLSVACGCRKRCPVSGPQTADEPTTHRPKAKLSGCRLRGITAHRAISENKMSEDKLPVKFELIKETLEPPFRDDFPGYTDGMARGEPGGFFIPPAFGQHADEFINFPLKADDVWIVTFPKCGTFSRRCQFVCMSHR